MGAHRRFTVEILKGMSLLFDIENLRCSYAHPFVEGVSHVVLDIRYLKLERGQRIFIVGESGIGKSTILETLGMMNNTIVPDSITRFNFYDANGREFDLCQLWQKGDKALSKFRLKNYSFIFQSTNLMRNFTAYENVAYTRMLQGYSKADCFEKTRQVLSELGMEHVDSKRMPQELSGGQQQRLAFARAVLPDYTVLFGDEPTGNLDPENAMHLMEILEKRSGNGLDTTAIIVSHDMHLATTFANVIVKIKKATTSRSLTNPEVTTCGIIDESCLFYPNLERNKWLGGDICMETSEFEDYLRKK